MKFIIASNILFLVLNPKFCESQCNTSQSNVFTLPESPLLLPDGVENDPDVIGVPSLRSNIIPCANRTINDICWEYPAVGSGMNSLGCDDETDLSTCTFVGISDRGPNQDCGDLGVRDSGKGFPVKEFSPVITTFKLDFNNGGDVEILSQMHLKDSGGNFVSGISNGPADDTPYNLNCAELLDYDHNGQDTEGIQRVEAPDGKLYYATVEEYSPSISFVEVETMEIKARYIPSDKTLENSTIPVYSILPASLSTRRKNRGLEAIACNQKSHPGGKQTIDGYKCWGFLQSPPQESSYLHRVVELDFSEGVDKATVTAEYVWEGSTTKLNSFGLDVSSSGPHPLSSPKNKPRDLKISAAFWVKGAEMIVLERAKSQVLYWKLDFSVATNVLNHSMEDSLEVLFSDIFPGNTTDLTAVNTLAENDIAPATKSLVADTDTIDGWELSAKQEGFAIINNVLVSVNDNDFGLEFNGLSKVGVAPLSSSCAIDEADEDESSSYIDMPSFVTYLLEGITLIFLLRW